MNTYIPKLKSAFTVENGCVCGVCQRVFCKAVPEALPADAAGCQEAGILALPPSCLRSPTSSTSLQDPAEHYGAFRSFLCCAAALQAMQVPRCLAVFIASMEQMLPALHFRAMTQPEKTVCMAAALRTLGVRAQGMNPSVRTVLASSRCLLTSRGSSRDTQRV